ncbi:MAG: PQQ-binding-like beta-propeller repeat protein [Gemmataceae bacterium]|nr:PQQ-binding-like beta-propeller repeat protein [Gemmataceae bacterium]
MQRRWIWMAVVLGLVALAQPAWALITRPIPLRLVLAENKFICVARVETLDPNRPSAVLTIAEDLKGTITYRRLPVNLTGDAEAKKLNHTPQLLKRLAPQLPVILFVNQREKLWAAFGYTNGTWFQMTGQKGDNDDPIVWRFTHCEPYLRRTFKGTTQEMRRVVIDGLSGKKKPPEVNEKEPPGFGPEVKPEKSSRLRLRVPFAKPQAAGGRPLFAVIPTLGVGGPLAILALLFPGLFGGVLLLFRRWAAFFIVVSVNSLIICLHLWLAGYFIESWWGTQTALWFIMTVVTLLGTLWAHWRNVRSVTVDQGLPDVPERTEQAVLWLLSGTCLLGVVVVALFTPPTAFEPWWNLLLVFAFGIWIGTLYKLLLGLTAEPRPALAGIPHPLAAERAVSRALATLASSEHVTSAVQEPPMVLPVHGTAFEPARKASRAALPTEAVILWVALFASVVYAAARPGPQGIRPGEGVAGEGRASAQLLKDKVRLKILEGNGTGFVLSSPLVVNDRIYIAAARGALDRFGVLYCLDAKTLAVLWEFSDEGAMKQVFSSPCLAGGKIYIGEGFHEDRGCKLYCIDAQTGKKIWDFPTGSHTEGTPVVVGGRVYFSAGDDGVYCCDALKGEKVWQFPDVERGKTLRLHVDMTPAVVGKRVYFGGGIDEETGEGDGVIVCLDADSGKEVWVHPSPKWMVRQGDPERKPLSLPVWGSPVVDRGQVFFGLGNGRMTESSKVYEPSGALLCVDALTGKERWSFRTSDGVLNRAAVDGSRVYFGSRDGHCYCLDRHTGKLRWKQALGSAVVATPALDRCGDCGHTSGVFVLAVEGQVCCLDPYTGGVQWSFDGLLQSSPALTSTPCVVTNHTPEGDRRRIYFGAALNGFTVPALYCLEDLARER